MLFTIIGMFALLFSFIPSGFFAVSVNSKLGYDKEIAEHFALANVTCYDLMGQDNMTYDYTSLEDHPSAPEFSLGIAEQYLEIWWGQEGLIEKCLEFRHTEKGFLGFWYHHKTRIYDKDHNVISFTYGMPPTTKNDRIVEGVTNVWGTFNHLSDSWDEGAEASIFYAECDHLVISALVGYNQSLYADIAEAYEAGELGYRLSYEINWNASSISAMLVLGQLLTFQSPNLGIDNPTANSILAGSIALPFWVMTAILIVIVIQSVIPFIRGIPD